MDDPGVNVCNRKGFEIGQLFSLEITLNIHEKRSTSSERELAI